MTTFSSTHRLDSLGPPAFGSRVTIHGCEEVTFWSVDGAAFELRFTPMKLSMSKRSLELSRTSR